MKVGICRNRTRVSKRGLGVRTVALCLSLLVGIEVAGCQGKSSARSVARTPAIPLKTNRVATLPKSDLCVYYLDFETRNLMRVSVDGAIRENVVNCGSGSGATLVFGGRGSALHLGGAPLRGGYTVIESTPHVSRVPFFNDFEPSKSPQPLELARSNVPSGWSLEFVSRPFELDPGHVHHSLEGVRLTKGSIIRTYLFDRTKSDQRAGYNAFAFLGMADKEHAVISDYPNVFVWHLVSDTRTCIASFVDNPVLWPRNLHSRARNNPVARGGQDGKSYKWEMQNPDDLEPTPERDIKYKPTVRSPELQKAIRRLQGK